MSSSNFLRSPCMLAMLPHLLLLLTLSWSSSPTAATSQIATRQANTMAKIYFAADDSAKLYVNGKMKAQTKQPKQLGTVTVPLKVGDVVGVTATDVGGGYGVIITIVMPNGARYRTSKANFVARDSFKLPSKPLAWTTPAYSACGWEDAVLTPAFPSSVAKPPTFPKAMDGAQYVWAAGAKGLTSVLVRFKIGGEKCDSNKLSRVYLAADDAAKLFVNGKLVASVTKPTMLAQAWYSVQKGDVIAIQARDIGGKYGVIAAIVTPTMKILTGSGKWKASAGFKKPPGASNKAWATPKFSVCSWTPPVLAPKGFAVPSSFPEEMNGAKYVWAPGTAGTTTIYLRYRIGGEQCPPK